VTVIMLVPAGVPVDATAFPLPQPAAAKTASRITATPPERTSAVKPNRDRSLPKYSAARRAASPAASNVHNWDIGRWLGACLNGPAPIIPLPRVVVIVSMGVVVPPGV
jgi:hypothetical protein